MCRDFKGLGVLMESTPEKQAIKNQADDEKLGETIWRPRRH
jgi:hypothetical protein